MPNPGSNEPIYSIGEVIKQVNGVLGERFPPIWVTGEVSNFTNRGHWYFDIIDKNNSLHCCMWKNTNSRVRFDVRNGVKVNIRVRLEIYAARGSFSAIVSDIELAGEGQLRAEYERLKLRLDSEGLFIKRAPLPTYPKRIAVITGEESAALEDVKTNIARRYPLVSLTVIPSLVQGANAPAQLEDAVRTVSELPHLFDVVLLTRGGGSFEDLNAFNHESLARAIFDCPIPVVSAVGHEIDFTICDLVADLRVPTPSTAAEEITPDIYEIKRAITSSRTTIQSRVANNLDRLTQDLTGLKGRLRDPNVILQLKHSEFSGIFERLQNNKENWVNGLEATIDQVQNRLDRVSPQTRVDVLEKQLEGLRHRLGRLHPVNQLTRYEERVRSAQEVIKSATKRSLTLKGEKIQQVKSRLSIQSPLPHLRSREEKVNELKLAMDRLGSTIAERVNARVTTLQDRMGIVSPLQTLSRGYAIVSKPHPSVRFGHPVRHVADLVAGDSVEAFLEDGSFKATIESVDDTPPEQRIVSSDD